MPKRRRRMEEQRHLYLILDDCPQGYNIRKIDLLADDLCQMLTIEDCTYARSQSLPSAIFSFGAERGMPHYFAGAFDSKILAMPQPINFAMDGKPMDDIPVYDVRMKSFMFGPQRCLEPNDPIYIPVSGRLFALADGSFELLYPPPRDEFTWEDFVWAWNKLPDLTFQSEHVTSYAVHPDGQTIFVSIWDWDCAVPVTLSFNTMENVIRDSKWKQHGQWKLPFIGQAYFDPELDAWVGLSKDPYGWICSCDVVSTNLDTSLPQCPPLKLSKEKLFNKDGKHEQLLGVKLVYLDSDWGECQKVKPILRLTTFSLKYDKKGELTRSNSCWIRCYSLPEEVTREMLAEPVAFWM
ncbi:unnamed protein product [Urochloa decumbens]|uniref:Uncharacterized protein n=1 Tax=Urochloa decumbens TaxID=240449 RepID=A0ABC8X566_9POAL